jgi:hypothetical protein
VEIGQKRRRSGEGRKEGQAGWSQAWKKRKENRKGCDGVGKENGRNHPQERGEIGLGELRESQKRLQQVKGWWHRGERSDTKGEPKEGGKPNRVKCNVPGGWL